MMKKIVLKKETLIGREIKAVGDVVEVDSSRASILIMSGAAVHHDSAVPYETKVIATKKDEPLIEKRILNTKGRK